MKYILWIFIFLIGILNYSFSDHCSAASDIDNHRFAATAPADRAPVFSGRYFSGAGDVKYLSLLDSAYGMLQPDPQIENLSMLYKKDWDGFVEGPTWNAWWIQNSFGPSYTMLPFMDPAYQTFIYNSQDMWFQLQGNGVRKDDNGYVGPVGVLCDAATPHDVWYRQGDGKVDLHDWCFGFTTAGILLESELMLVRRDTKEIIHYLPLLEKSADFVDSRRDKQNNMFLVGAAANLLAPSYAGTGALLADSSYGKAYLAEISVNYAAALDRLIELEKWMGRMDKATAYVQRRSLVIQGLENFMEPDGYLIRSIDPDGTRHGVYGAARHGYFEAAPNQDAMAFRVADEKGARRIYDKIRSIPQLRPYSLIIPNYPSYDDMYDTGGLFTYGKWVNGGEWATCEARMQIGYYRVGAYDDAAAGFTKILKLADDFRMDNDLPDFGNALYQPSLPLNCVYDCWGAPGGFLRGLFEYVYKADGLTLYPHIPEGIHSLNQHFPVYFGKKRLFISTNGNGHITSVKVNGRIIAHFGQDSVFLQMDGDQPGVVNIAIGLGNAPAMDMRTPKASTLTVPAGAGFWNIDALKDAGDTTARLTQEQKEGLKKIGAFYQTLIKAGLDETYECQHAALILKCIQSIDERKQLKQTGQLRLLPQRTGRAADDLYISTVLNLEDGLVQHMQKSKVSAPVLAAWQNL